MKDSDAPSVRDIPVSSGWLLSVALTSVAGAVIAAVSLGLDTAAIGALGQWVYIAGLGAALTSITVVAFSAQSRREAIAGAKSHAHELAMRREQYGGLDLAPEERERAAFDLVVLEDAHAFEHATTLRAALGLETDWRPNGAPWIQAEPTMSEPRQGRAVPGLEDAPPEPTNGNE